jgi:hypothetical protein
MYVVLFFHAAFTAKGMYNKLLIKESAVLKGKISMI